MARTSVRRLLGWFLAVLLALAAVAAILGGAIIVFASRQITAPARPSGLAGYVRPADVDARLVLRDLAGMPAKQVLEYAVSAGKPGTGLSIVAYSESLTDPERANSLLALAHAFAAAKDSERAAGCYQAPAATAVLGAEFHDYQRATLLLQAGDGLRDLGRSTEAEDAYDRVAELARFSPTLQAAVRGQLLHSLAVKYGELGRQAKAEDAAHWSLSLSQPSEFLPVAVELPAGAAVWENDAVYLTWKEREAARIVAVIDLITALEARPSGPVEAKRLAVEQALVAERDAQDVFFADESSRPLGVSARLALYQLRVSWLTLEWRVSARGFGMALAPDWEARLQESESNLRQAQEDYYTVRLETAALLPNALAASQAAVDALVEEIKLGRLGLYPMAPEQGLAGDLTDAISQRVALRLDDTLYVVPATRGGSAEFVFAFATADQLLRQ
jgi:hypothetical protein